MQSENINKIVLKYLYDIEHAEFVNFRKDNLEFYDFETWLINLYIKAINTKINKGTQNDK